MTNKGMEKKPSSFLTKKKKKIYYSPNLPQIDWYHNYLRSYIILDETLSRQCKVDQVLLLSPTACLTPTLVLRVLGRAHAKAQHISEDLFKMRQLK